MLHATRRLVSKEHFSAKPNISNCKFYTLGEILSGRILPRGIMSWFFHCSTTDDATDSAASHWVRCLASTAWRVLMWPQKNASTCFCTTLRVVAIIISSAGQIETPNQLHFTTFTTLHTSFVALLTITFSCLALTNCLNLPNRCQMDRWSFSTSTVLSSMYNVQTTPATHISADVTASPATQ